MKPDLAEIGFLKHPSREIYQIAYHLRCASSYRESVAILAESVFELHAAGAQQLDIFSDVDKQTRLVSTLGAINAKHGNVITPARMIDTEHLAPDQISFGSVKELEEMIVS